MHPNRVRELRESIDIARSFGQAYEGDPRREIRKEEILKVEVDGNVTKYKNNGGDTLLDYKGNKFYEGVWNYGVTECIYELDLGPKIREVFFTGNNVLLGLKIECLWHLHGIRTTAYVQNQEKPFSSTEKAVDWLKKKAAQLGS